MKNKILITAFAAAVIASFSFISISKETTIMVKNESKSAMDNPTNPISGFALEDENQFN